MQQSLQQSRLCDSPPSTSFPTPPAEHWKQQRSGQWQRLNIRQRRSKLEILVSSVAAAENGALQKASRIPALPFVKVAGQEEMKLALLLNVVDPRIGGVLIMGDRGTGKSVAVSTSCYCFCRKTFAYSFKQSIFLPQRVPIRPAECSFSGNSVI